MSFWSYEIYLSFNWRTLNQQSRAYPNLWLTLYKSSELAQNIAADILPWERKSAGKRAQKNEITWRLIWSKKQQNTPKVDGKYIFASWLETGCFLRVLAIFVSPMSGIFSERFRVHIPKSSEKRNLLLLTEKRYWGRKK